jgi:transposase
MTLWTPWSSPALAPPARLNPGSRPPPKYATCKPCFPGGKPSSRICSLESHREEKLAFTQVPAPVQDSLEAHIAWLTQARDALTKEIDRHIDRHPGLKKDRALLQSIPGVGPKVSALMLAILRQGQFASTEQSAVYLGLVPVERQSGSSVKGRSRLSKNGPARVRATLYLPAVCAKRCNPHIRDMAERMALRGKCDLSIIGAAMRKLAHLCFGVIKHQLPYQPLYSKKC